MASGLVLAQPWGHYVIHTMYTCIGKVFKIFFMKLQGLELKYLVDMDVLANLKKFDQNMTISQY